ncbi:ABC transporter substrate-binding protein [Acinetobacter seifertii]|nr:ABC transporter substrate-binding protein [Acinetobacter seifertii]
MEKKMIICGVVTVSISLIGCAPPKKENKNTLIYCSEGSPELLNPQKTLSGTARTATATTIYDRLVDFKPGTMEIVPSLAESWQVSKDGTEYVFKLKNNISFQETNFFKPKRNLNADDVIFSIERQLDVNNPYHKVNGINYQYFQGMGFSENIESVDKIDDLNLRIKLKKPDYIFIKNMALPFMSILSKEYADYLIKENRREDIDNIPLGTGPYYFISYVPDSVIKYKANNKYWGDKPLIENLIISITPDIGVRMEKLKKGECDIIVSPNPHDIDEITKNKEFKVIKNEGINIGYLALNTEKKPLDNLKVRQAIAYALNKKSYIDIVYNNKATIAINPYPKNVLGYNDSVKKYNYNVEESKKLLNEAGYPNGIDLELWTLPVSRPYNPDGKKMGQLMQSDLAKANIRVKIKSYEWGTYLQKVKNGEHQLVQLGWNSDNGDPDNFLFPLLSCESVDKGSNNARYCNKEFNDIITNAKLTNNQDIRKKLYEEALTILANDEPIVPLAHADIYRISNNRLSGYINNPFDLDYFQYLTFKGENNE